MLSKIWQAREINFKIGLLPDVIAHTWDLASNWHRRIEFKTSLRFSREIVLCVVAGIYL